MKLTTEQQHVVNNNDGRALVIAGPGSGKTHTLIAKVRHLVENGYTPSGIHIVTFTNAAAREVRKRLGEIKPGYVGTLHGMAFRLIDLYRTEVGFSTAPLGIIDEEMSKLLLKQCAERLKYRGSQKALKEADERFDPTHKEVSRSKENAVLGAFYGSLRDNNLLDYDSMLKYAKTLAVRGFHLGADVLMVDEVQDSGYLDFDIYNALAIHSRLFMVGDPDQAIYSFRGGKAHLILREADLTPPLLIQGNHRSGRQICLSAQTLIENNVNRFSKQTESMTGTAGHVHVCPPAKTPAEEMGQFVEWFQSQNPNPSEVAILVRINKLRESLTDLLGGVGIPINTKELKPVPEDWAFARQCLMLIANPFNDTIARMIIEKTDGPAEAARVAQNAAYNGVSINQSRWNLPYDSKPADVPELMAVNLGVGVESCELFAAMLEDMPEIQTVGELGVAVAADLFHEDETGEGVTVTTIHSAKGREWDHVWVMGFEDHIIPGTRKGLDVEEERRLAYVAVTRARETLHVSYCANRPPLYRRGVPEPVEPSRYLWELIPGGVSKGGTAV